MKQSLPGITSIATLPCLSVPLFAMEKALSGIPVGIMAKPSPVTLYGVTSCEAESEYDNASYLEKVTLQFETTDSIDTSSPLAFVVHDANRRTFLIGCREAPYPVIEINKSNDNERNISKVKVSFTRRKALIPCHV